MRFLFLLVSTPLLLALPAAFADGETRPGCERGQPWIGYARTDPARAAYADAGGPGGLAVCEGEHWDGQDPLVAEDAPCSGNVRTNDVIFVGFCLGNDPNGARGDDPLAPLGARVAADGTRAAYVATNVALVARVAVYADDGTLGLYVRDNTHGNLIMTLLEPPRPVNPVVGETDHDQAYYQECAYAGHACPRDNTAVTLEHGLLA